MANKKMIENLKRNSVKSVAGILIAATLMSTAVPALADPLNPPVAVEQNADSSNAESDGGKTYTNDNGTPGNDNVNQDMENPYAEDSGKLYTNDNGTPGNDNSNQDMENPYAKDNNNKPDADKEDDNFNLLDSEEGDYDPIEEEEENNENANGQSADKDPDLVNVGTKDVNALKKQMDDEAKEEKEKNEKAINDIGGIAGSLLVKYCKEKDNYKDSQALADDMAVQTLKLFNKTFMKQIPYCGGFLKSIVDGLFGSADPTISGFKDVNDNLITINDSLKTINASINSCTKQILAEVDKTKVDEKIKELNSAAETLDDQYSANSTNFTSAWNELAKEDETKSVSTAYTYMQDIYNSSKTGADYYIAYKKFVETLLNKKQLLNTYREFGGEADVFDLFNSSITSNKLNIMTFNAERIAFTDKVEDYCNNSYDILDKLMGVDMAISKNTRDACDTKIAALKEQLKTATGDEAKALEAEIEEYKSKRSDSDFKYNNTYNRYKTLVSLKAQMDARIKAQRDKIKSDEEYFKDHQPAESVVYDNVTYGTEKINGRIAYPQLDTTNHKIIYTDVYGNKLGERTYNTENAKISQYDVKKGGVYTFKCNDPWNSSEVHYIRVTKVEEVAGTLWGTNRTITGVDLNDGKTYTFTLGFWGSWTASCKKVGDIEVTTD